MNVKKTEIMMRNDDGEFEFSHYVWKVYSSSGEFIGQCESQEEADNFIAEFISLYGEQK
jgi:hypothetical protein